MSRKPSNRMEQATRFLAGSIWLSRFPEGLRQEFLSRCKLLPPFKRGQRVFNIGDRPDGIYGVVSGAFGFEIAPGPDGPQMVHQFRAGDWFGELAHVLGCPRLTTVQAACPSLCVRISARDLNTLLDQDPRMWQAMALALAHYSLLAMTAVHDLMERSPRKRLISTLLRVAGIRDDTSKDGQVVELSLTHSSLALLTNLSRSLVAETLHALEAQNHLQCRYGHIFLLDPAELRKSLTASQKKARSNLELPDSD